MSHHGDCKRNLRNAGLKSSDDFIIMALSHNAKSGTDKNKPQEFLRGSFILNSTDRVSPKAVPLNKVPSLDVAAHSLNLL